MAELEKGQLKRTAVTFGGMRLAWLTFQSLGIIYSDIGTSPLYTLNSIWPSSAPAPSTEDIIGGLSALIWSLTLIPLTKYVSDGEFLHYFIPHADRKILIVKVFICLQFGTHEGEGGTFALYQGLYPPTPLDFDADRTLTGDSGDYKVKSTPKTGRALGETVRWPLLVWVSRLRFCVKKNRTQNKPFQCLFGTSLTIADGVLTPAVSVTSAVSGIGVAQPSVVNDVIPISIVSQKDLSFATTCLISAVRRGFSSFSFCANDLVLRRLEPPLHRVRLILVYAKSILMILPQSPAFGSLF